MDHSLGGSGCSRRGVCVLEFTPQRAPITRQQADLACLAGDHDAVFVGEYDCLDAVAQPELEKDGPDVALDRGLGDDEPRRDYHRWDAREDRAYRAWLAERHRAYIEYRRLNQHDQQEVELRYV